MTSSRRFRLALGAGLSVVALEAVWLRVQIGGEPASQVFSDVVDLPILAVAVAACWAAGRRETGRTRTGWRLLGLGLGAWGVGQATWTYYEIVLGREVPFPSPADAGYLGLIPLAAWGLLLFPAAPTGRAGRTRALLDGLIITTSIFALSWALVLGPLYRAESESVVEKVLGLAYPFGDAVLIGVVLFVAARATGSDRSTLSLIATGLAVLALADGVFTYLTIQDAYSTGNIIDAAWTLGFVLIGSSAFRPVRVHTKHDDKPSSIGAAVLPYAAIAVGVPIVAVQFATQGLDPVVFALGVALFTVVSIRQLLAVRENGALAHELDRKVTERTAELEGSLRQLAEARRLQDEFVSNATHELRTPLTIIMGAVDTLADPDDPISDEAPMLIDMARDGARRMNDVVDDLLLASGIRDTWDATEVVFDVSACVHEALSASNLEDKTVVSDLTPGVVATGDPDRFRKALAHVLGNADKFAPSRSTVRVAVRHGGGGVWVTVTDEGPGIAPHLREAVFRRFFQADPQEGRRYGGLGLGLHLARGVMRAMGGDVTVEDAVTGCAVRLSLVAAPAAASDAALDVDVEARVSRPERGFDRRSRAS